MMSLLPEEMRRLLRELVAQQGPERAALAYAQNVPPQPQATGPHNPIDKMRRIDAAMRKAFPPGVVAGPR